MIIDAAVEWAEELGRPVVIKLDGLAAGKGVTVPESPGETFAAIGVTTEPFVLEERMHGPECSLLALCDGRVARALPLAQDHKRIGEGDTGPNTGGMGAYAPAPVPYAADELVATFVQPVLDHFAAAGTPYVGVLYAGLMLTADGPRLVEYNVRFGDPEAQAVLPLLRSDLAALALAATEGRLADVAVDIADGAACTVVAASPGYPDAPVVGKPVLTTPGITERSCDSEESRALLFPAGMADGVTTGGRVLAVTGLGPDLAAARAAAYEAMAGIEFDGMQVRRDIGWRAPGATLRVVRRGGRRHRRRHPSRRPDPGRRRADPRRRGRAGGRQLRRRVLGQGDRGDGRPGARGVDRRGRHEGRARGADRAGCAGSATTSSTTASTTCSCRRRGRCSSSTTSPPAASTPTSSPRSSPAWPRRARRPAARCSAARPPRCPASTRPGSFDVAGTLVGVAERSALLPRPDVAAGDVLVGVASSGPHTNGYSLLRRLFEWIPLDVTPAGLDRPLGDALLEPHRSYLRVLEPALATGRVKALAHVTGGGLVENVPRVLPAGVDARVELASWPLPPLFALVRELATGARPRLSSTAPSTWGSAWSSSARPPTPTPCGTRSARHTWIIGELVPGTPGEPAAVRLV